MQHRVGPIEEFVKARCVGRTASDSDCTMGSELERVLGLATNTGCILSFVSPRYLAAVVCSLVSAHFVRERAKHSENSVSSSTPSRVHTFTHVNTKSVHTKDPRFRTCRASFLPMRLRTDAPHCVTAGSLCRHISFTGRTPNLWAVHLLLLPRRRLRSLRCLVTLMRPTLSWLASASRARRQQL
jgi:hypothetical protein